ncbi:MAG: carboxypeptidase-like regulatory domain-containing protein [Prevotellaceae bacterium]|jgi:hypothetical protein|nr:carboxypeptidase-like regulatory domain-containing protein [Prevotellaceae bacterium]
MRLINFLRTFAFVALLGSTITMMVSCKEDEENPVGNLGTITGTVTAEEDGQPIDGVTVTVSDVTGTVTTGSDGKYTVANVSVANHSVTFSKTGWQNTSVTVAASRFNADKVATVNASLRNASAKITGHVFDGENNRAPLAGVTVSVGAAGSATSDATGEYTVDYLAVEDYTVTFTKEGYPSDTRNVVRADFVNGVATLDDVVMGGTELLRGKTATALANADKWYYNEYRGGGNAEAYPHWDWACDYMCALDFWGAWEEQWEGTTIQTRNDAAAGDRNNPADLDVFDSYVYGSKKITNDNKILSLRLRTHSETDPTIFGVQVVDLSAASPAAVKIGTNQEYVGSAYTDFDFDLSAYVGKEVVIAIGTYRAATGDYSRQLVLRRIAFAPQKMEGWNWQSGTDPAGLEGWALPMEVVRSTMPQTKKSFTGISPYGAGRDVSMTNGYPYAYRWWREIAHIGFEWSFVPLAKDPEVTPFEGYIIKTNGNVGVNTTVPQAYLYAKFAITGENDQLTLKTRNFGSNYTYFKLTAIKEDGTVAHLSPASNTATEAAAATNGCWRFKHANGNPDNPDNYASFVYNLSQFNGSNVLLCLSVFKGGTDTDENKVCIYSIELQ